MSQTNEFDVLSPEREKPLNPWQPERDPIRLAILGKLQEELAEAQAIVARCLIQGIDESEPVTGVPNRLAFQNELADVRCTLWMAMMHFELDQDAMTVRFDKKREHLYRWHDLIRKEEQP